MTARPKLIAPRYGRLYTRYEDIADDLAREHADGSEVLLTAGWGEDLDTCSWPDYDPDILRAALFDARECGYLPANCLDVELPDGTIFSIDL